MAMFIGSLAEFKKYFQGFCKNKVAQMTKSAKTARENICEYCGQKRELETVPIKGNERMKIIESILNENFKQSETVDNYFIDLDKFEKYFIEVLNPIEKHFHFLCYDCHSKYDRRVISEIQIRNKTINAKNKPCEMILNSPPSFCSDDYRFGAPQIDKSQSNLSEMPLEFNKRENETVQNYVKRLLVLCRDNGFLTSDRLAQLQDLKWCKLNFHLEYSLLEKDRWKTIVSGHSRYYKNFTLICGGTEYYVCSQWWKELFPTYERKLKKWVEKLFQN